MTEQDKGQPPVPRGVIRDIFMAHGFTVREGQTDLKEYVYAAAYSLLSAVRSAPNAAPVPTPDNYSSSECGVYEAGWRDGFRHGALKIEALRAAYERMRTEVLGLLRDPDTELSREAVRALIALTANHQPGNEEKQNTPQGATRPTNQELTEFGVAEQFMLFCDEDEFLQIANAVLDKYATRCTGVPDDFHSHKLSWRNAIDTLRKAAHDPDKGYWAHELRAFDRAYEELARATHNTPPTEQPQEK